MTISESQPKWKLEESIIGTNPGVGFRPISSEVEQGSLIWYDSSNQTQVKYWTSILDEFMQGMLEKDENIFQRRSHLLHTQ